MILFARLAYLLFLATLAYSIWFTVFGVDTGVAEPLPRAAAIDAGLLALFALQHSGMARRAFKRAWTRIVPVELERSLYVLAASLCLILLFWQWRPIPARAWDIAHPVLRAALWLVQAAGWVVVIYATFLIDHRDLFGLRQVRDRPYAPPPFRTPRLYRRVRHPIYFGFVVAFWATPHMTLGHLLFAAAATLYVLAGIQLEERDLLHRFGDAYRRYRLAVPMLVPSLKPGTLPMESPPAYPSASAATQSGIPGTRFPR